jgi:hypothetical protein
VPSITGIAIVDVLMSQEPWREAALHDALRHLVLPSLVLAVVPTTEVIRHVRSSLIDVMKQNYIKAAASRGLSRRQIVWRHGLKNALPPVLPLLGLQLGSVLTSAMITEVVFDWPASAAGSSTASPAGLRRHPRCHPGGGQLRHLHQRQHRAAHHHHLPGAAQRTLCKTRLNVLMA